jgi:hypothetical protein
MKKKLKSLNGQLEKKSARAEMMEQGGYDGRFSPRVVKDKKKESSRNWAKQRSWE